MKNEKKYYFIAWIAAVIVFNLIMFLLPNALLDVKDGIFWIIYLTVMVSFFGQAALTALYASKERKAERFLYIPVVVIGYIALLMTLLLALQALTLQFLPNWFTIIVAVLVVVYYLFAVLRTLAAADMIIEVDKKLETTTEFIRGLITQCRTLEKIAAPELAGMVKKVWENFRYSDPVSCPEVAVLEGEILAQYCLFEEAIKGRKEAEAKTTAQKLVALITERNELCKSNKEK